MKLIPGTSNYIATINEKCVLCHVSFEIDVTIIKRTLTGWRHVKCDHEARLEDREYSKGYKSNITQNPNATITDFYRDADRIDNIFF